MNSPSRAKPVTLLIPGARVPTQWFSDRAFDAAVGRSALGHCLRRGGAPRGRRDDALAPLAMAHQRWIAAAFGLDSPGMLCAASAGADGLADAGWRLVPVSLRPAMDHLSLGSLLDTALAADEAEALARTADELLAEEGWHVRRAESGRWYLLGAHGLELATRPPEVALGRNIDAYLPEGPGGRRWRRRLAEIEMAWHVHPANAAREQRGLAPVNSLWLCGPVPRPRSDMPAAGSGGGGAAPMSGAPFARVFTDDACLAGLARVVGAPVVPLENAGAAPDGAGPLLLAPHALLEPLLERDPSRWLAALEASATPMLRLAQRLAASSGGALELVLCGEQSTAQTVIRPSDRWCFWRDRRPAESLAEVETTNHG